MYDHVNECTSEELLLADALIIGRVMVENVFKIDYL